jgi:hypothetical protein
MGLFLCMAYPHLHLLCSRNVGVLGGWRNILSDRNIAWLLSLVFLKVKMNNPYLTVEEIGETFRGVNLEENYNFLEDDLVALANAFVMAAMPAIVRQERNLCIDFVNSLNTEVGKALQEKRGSL